MRLVNLLTGAGLLSLSTVSVASEALPAKLETGRGIYNEHCYFCHGYSGDAKTLASLYLEPAPLDFTRTRPETLTREHMIDAVSSGKPGTAMQAYSRLLDRNEIAAVVEFVRDEFMLNSRANSRYHTAENGWPDHQRYAPAFPFVSGQATLEDWPQSAAATGAGQLFASACISCHEPVAQDADDAPWRKRSVSYPRNDYSNRTPDSVSSASVYARHDIVPVLAGSDADVREGQRLWQQNCAFCHAADGSGENWIGSFLEASPRNLTNAGFMRSVTPALLRQRIRDGIAGTSMPAWKDVLDDTQIDQIVTYIDAVFYPLDAE